jgi:Putative prokaryotic signal transducing protein
MVVYVAYNEPEAYIVAGRLQSEGIRAFVHQEPVGRAYGLSVGPLGEVKVLVHPDQYDQSLEIIEDGELLSEDSDIVPDDDE